MTDKLAVWAGFKEDKQIVPGHTYWLCPDGGYTGELPDFPNDLNALFKWAVPPDKTTLVRFLPQANGNVHCTVRFDSGVETTGLDKGYSLALFQAILKLIEEGGMRKRDVW